MSNAKTKPKWSIKAVLLFILTTVAFLASFVALFVMAVLAGWSPWIAWGLPVMIDRAIVMTIIDMVDTRRMGGKPRFALLVFSVCSLLSTFLNGYHAYISPGDLGLPGLIRVVIGITPPLLLLMLTKLFESAIERDAPLEVLAEESASTEPATALAVAPEALAISEAKLAAPAAEHVDTVAIEAPAPEPALANPVAVPVPVAEAVDSDDVAADDQIDTVATEFDTAIDSGSRLAIVTDLKPAEVIPEEPDGQIEWIVSQARAGVDLSSWKTLAQLLSDGGRPLGDRTVQRRLAAAREQAPEAFAA